jgi:2-oxoglutarate dehydrogenase E1 component
MDPFSYVANADTQVIADLYENYKQDPNSVDNSWRDFFKGFDFSQTWLGEGAPSGTASADSGHIQKEMAVISLIKAFRSRGHLLSNTNPVRVRKDRQPRLALTDYALSDADLDTVFQAGTFLGIGPATLRQIQDALHKSMQVPSGLNIHTSARWIRRNGCATRLKRKLWLSTQPLKRKNIS